MKLTYKPDITISYSSTTGEKMKRTNHWLYDENNSGVCLCSNTDNVESNVALIVKAVNMHEALIECLASYNDIECEHSQSLFSDKLDALLEQAKGK